MHNLAQTHTHTHTHTHTQRHTHAPTHMHTLAQAHTHTHTLTQTLSHTHAHTYTHTHSHTHTHKQTNKHKHTEFRSGAQVWQPQPRSLQYVLISTTPLVLLVSPVLPVKTPRDRKVQESPIYQPAGVFQKEPTRTSARIKLENPKSPDEVLGLRHDPPPPRPPLNWVYWSCLTFCTMV